MSNTNPGPASTVTANTGSPITNASVNAVLSAALTPSQVSANTSAEQTFTVTGLKVGDFVGVNKPTAQAGLAIVGCRVSAADTLAITFGNFTASGITPTAGESYLIHVLRLNASYSSAPTSLPLL